MAYHCCALLFPFSWGLNLKCVLVFFPFLSFSEVQKKKCREEKGQRLQETKNIVSLLKEVQSTKPQWPNSPRHNSLSFLNYLFVNLTVLQMLSDVRIIRSKTFFSSLWNLNISAKLLPVGRCFCEKQTAWICCCGIYFLSSPIFI